MPDRDAELLRALHDQHGAALWAYALRLTSGDRGRAEDVVQETLLRAWRRPEVLDQSVRSARPWLFTVAHRIVIDDWRHRRARAEVPVAEPPDDPPAAADGAGTDPTDQVLLGFVVTQALRRLTAAHRDVVLACYYQGRSVAEAAEQLAIPEGTVKSRLHYALRALRVALEELGVTS